jgi:hypothetical protein
MLTAARPRSTAADLLRLLAIWMAVILCAQGAAAAWALGAGPRHHHRPAAPEQGHVHAHAESERHHHAGEDPSVVADADAAEALEAAARALAAALSHLAPGGAHHWADGRSHDRPVTQPLVLHGSDPPPPLKPPRHA